MKIAQDPVSLETPIGEEEDSHLGDFIQTRTRARPADAASQTILREVIERELHTPTPRRNTSSSCASDCTTAERGRWRRSARSSTSRANASVGSRQRHCASCVIPAAPAISKGFLD